VSPGESSVRNVVCLGCGCVCDDIAVTVRDGRIVAAERACRLGVEWFGTGAVPARIRVRGTDAALGDAIDAAASLLAGAERALIYLAGDVSCEAQRAAIGIADLLHALLDSVSSSTARSGILAAQRRGRAGATLGEIRNRADLLLFWGVDPERRYPRYGTRYAPEPPGLHLPNGRRDRRVIAVDIGDLRGPTDADTRFTFAPAEEERALAATRAALLGRAAAAPSAESIDARAAALATALAAGRYVAIVHDGEPTPGVTRSTAIADAILALAETLNATTRSAVSTLRAGGNRSGADSVLTWQTGFPMTVDFGRGRPSYRPDDGAAAWLTRRDADAVLIVGSASVIPADVRDAMQNLPCVHVGPRASGADLRSHVSIDTGVAGIHDGGVALRMDDVPLPLRPVLATPADAAATVSALAIAIGNRVVAAAS